MVFTSKGKSGWFTVHLTISPAVVLAVLDSMETPYRKRTDNSCRVDHLFTDVAIASTSDNTPEVKPLDGGGWVSISSTLKSHITAYFPCN